MSGTRILIVEDDEGTRAYLAEALLTLEYTVTAAVASGELAIRHAAEHPPDVVLMDITLAGKIDGIEAAARIRRSQAIPIIYLTASAESDLIERLKATEPFGYLRKPVHLQDLRMTVDLAVYKHCLETDLRETNRQLEEEIAERQQMETELKKYRDHLEVLVNERTAALQQEIVERARIEAALRESEAKYKALYTMVRLMCDNVPDLIWAKDMAKRFLFTNKAICEKLLNATDPDEPTGKTDMYFADRERCAHPANPQWHTFGENCANSDAVVMDARKPERFDEFGNVQGAFLYLDVYKAPFLDEHGRMLGTVGCARIVTKEKELEAERQRAEDTLRASERRYSAIVEDQTDLICRFLPNGAFTFINTAFCWFFGKDGEELRKTSFFTLIADISATLNHLTPLAPTITRETPVRFSEIAIYWVQWDIRLLFAEDGQVMEYQAVGRDLTERKRQEELLKNQLQATVKDRYRFGSLIGKSAAMQHIYDLIVEAAATDEAVIIYGESGTGKELIAQTIHQLSKRQAKAFVPVNCGAIPEPLFESELFGYRKGAFTGAYADKPGFFDVAHQGTLFLDEIGELSPAMQVKLLRALESGEYLPVGDHVHRHANVRIIAATNRNPVEQVQNGTMREDFFYRIHVIAITVPPLRERKEDIPLLLDQFLKQFDKQPARPILPGETLARLYGYNWPGNVRELQNVLRRYVTVQRLDFTNPHASAPLEREERSAAVKDSEVRKLREALADFEQRFIRTILAQQHWHKGKTAAILGIPRRTLHRKLKKLGIR